MKRLIRKLSERTLTLALGVALLATPVLAEVTLTSAPQPPVQTIVVPASTMPRYQMTNSVSVRAEASLNSAVLGVASKGDGVTVVEKLDGWYKINFAGKIGFVQASYIKDNAPEPAAPAPAQPPIQTVVVPASSIPRYVVTSNVSVRAEASSSSAVLGVASKGDGATVIEKVDGWYKINFAGKIGFVPASFIKDNAPEPVAAQPPVQTVVIPASSIPRYQTTGNVNVRSEASSNSAILGVARKGDGVTVVEKVGNWYKVNYVGEIGYIHASFIKDNAPVEKEAAPVATVSPQPPVQTIVVPATTEPRFQILNNVSVRTEANSSSAVLGVASKGDGVTVVEKVGDWYKINFGGKIGYVHASNILDKAPAN